MYILCIYTQYIDVYYRDMGAYINIGTCVGIWVLRRLWGVLTKNSKFKANMIVGVTIGIISSKNLQS